MTVTKHLRVATATENSILTTDDETTIVKILAASIIMKIASPHYADNLICTKLIIAEIRKKLPDLEINILLTYLIHELLETTQKLVCVLETNSGE